MVEQPDERLRDLSARLDKNHADITAQLDELYQKREAASHADWHHYEQQIRRLKEQEIRLLKSKNTAWMAHWLRRDGEVEITETPYRKLGAALIGISVAGILALGYYWWTTQGG